jgi:glycosyltransferase involved in cell wall biosynthesis
MKIGYFCMSPHVSLANAHRAPSVHIRAVVTSLQALGHQVCPYIYGDLLHPAEARLRRRAGPARRAHPLIQRARFLAGELLILWQDRTRDRALIEPVFRGDGLDLAYERLFAGKAAVSACARHHRVPLIVESNAPALERKSFWNTPLYPLIRAAERQVLRRADAVLLVSAALKRYYERDGIPAEKMVVFPNAVDPGQFSPERVNRNIRHELGLDGSIVVGFVGNVHPYHGPELLLPLARHLAEVEGLRFLIVGVGDLARQELRVFLEQEQLTSRIVLVGSVPNTDIPGYVQAMDICVLPRFMWYGSPMKIFEYGAMAKPIVAPDLENIREVLTHDQTALLFEPDNLAGLGAAIRALAASAELRVRLGGCAQRDILAHHTWANRAQRIVEIRAAIASGRWPRPAMGSASREGA